MQYEFWVRSGDVFVGTVHQTDRGDWCYESHVTGRRIDLWPDFQTALDALIRHLNFELEEKKDEKCYGGAGGPLLTDTLWG